MENLKIGFIGGGALTMSMLKNLSLHLPPKNIFVCDHKATRCQALREEYQINATTDAVDFLPGLDVLILAVKPKDATKALCDLREHIAAATVIASVVAGMKLTALEEILPQNPVVRVMPNVAQAVGEGMAALSRGAKADDGTTQKISSLWNLVGKTIEVSENLMDAVTGLSGSGPAYAFITIEALADGGVAAGLSRSAALTLAAQTMLGAAKMVMETQTHPGALKDQVTSPAGTTIAGLRVLENRGVRSAFIEAVVAAAEKSKILGGTGKK